MWVDCEKNAPPISILDMNLLSNRKPNQYCLKQVQLKFLTYQEVWLLFIWFCGSTILEARFGISWEHLPPTLARCLPQFQAKHSYSRQEKRREVSALTSQSHLSESTNFHQQSCRLLFTSFWPGLCHMTIPFARQSGKMWSFYTVSIVEVGEEKLEMSIALIS